MTAAPVRYGPCKRSSDTREWSDATALPAAVLEGVGEVLLGARVIVVEHGEAADA
jgi:hypothetical protein